MTSMNLFNESNRQVPKQKHGIHVAVITNVTPDMTVHGNTQQRKDMSCFKIIPALGICISRQNYEI